MSKLLKVLIVVLVFLCLTFGAIAEDYRQTYSLDGLLSYTVYDPGYVFISEDKKTHFYYPSNGGILMIQYSDMPRSFSAIYNESVLYDTVFPTLVSGFEANSDRYVFLSEKRFMFANYYAFQISFGFVQNETNTVRDDAYLIATPNHLITVHFISNDTQGAISKENLPFVLASFVFAD